MEFCNLVYLNEVQMVNESRQKILVRVLRIVRRNTQDAISQDYDYHCIWTSIDLIVVDLKGTRMKICLNKPDLVMKFGDKFQEKGCYYIGNFMVIPIGNSIHPRIQLRLKPKSMVVRTYDLLPFYQFRLRSVTEALGRIHYDDRAIDVYGKVKFIDDLRHVKVNGTMTMQISFHLYDNSNRFIRVFLHGLPAFQCSIEYPFFSDLVPLCVLIEYCTLQVRNGETIITNFATATRVHFNPQFQQVQHFMSVAVALEAKRMWARKEPSVVVREFLI